MSEYVIDIGDKYPTPQDKLHRLKEFAMYGLDECEEIEVLVRALEDALQCKEIID